MEKDVVIICDGDFPKKQYPQQPCAQRAFVAQYKTTEEFERNPFSVIYVGSSGNAYELEYTETGRLNRSFEPVFFDEAFSVI